MTNYVVTNSSVGPYQFQPVLDNLNFLANITYNLYGDRYYMNLYYQQTLVYSTPLIGSVAGGFQINLLPGLNPITGNPWVSTITYNSQNSTLTVLP